MIKSFKRKPSIPTSIILPNSLIPPFGKIYHSSIPMNFGEGCIPIPSTPLKGWGSNYAIVQIDSTSHPEVFCKKDVLKNFSKFAGKHLCQSIFLNKAASLRPATLLKRDSGRCFLVKHAKFLRTPFLQNTPGGCFFICDGKLYSNSP